MRKYLAPDQIASQKVFKSAYQATVWGWMASQEPGQDFRPSQIARKLAVTYQTVMPFFETLVLMEQIEQASLPVTRMADTDYHRYDTNFWNTLKPFLDSLVELNAHLTRGGQA